MSAFPLRFAVIVPVPERFALSGIRSHRLHESHPTHDRLAIMLSVAERFAVIPPTHERLAIMLDTSDIEAVSSLVPDKFAVQILPIDNAHATAPVHETVVVADISHHLYARSHEYGGCVPV